ncbi:hypothetical protein B0H13DRAFT_2501757 [Mycena leptocephala]|nr:hypothetical protein B0H13DRAFT_2501757 [Mycena leptocephala]
MALFLGTDSESITSRSRLDVPSSTTSSAITPRRRTVEMYRLAPAWVLVSTGVDAAQAVSTVGQPHDIDPQDLNLPRATAPSLPFNRARRSAENESTHSVSACCVHPPLHLLGVPPVVERPYCVPRQYSHGSVMDPPSPRTRAHSTTSSNSRTAPSSNFTPRPFLLPRSSAGSATSMSLHSRSDTRAATQKSDVTFLRYPRSGSSSSSSSTKESAKRASSRVTPMGDTPCQLHSPVPDIPKKKRVPGSRSQAVR